MTILVTGANGMIGSRLVKGLVDAAYDVVGIDRVGEEIHSEHLNLLKVDLSDLERLQRIVEEFNVDRIIHLAALAHTKRGVKVSWDDYKHTNVDCAKNVFIAAGDRPVLFISTVDVYGLFDGKGTVKGSTEIHPVSMYGKSKALAEAECKKLNRYSIFRFCPVYSDDLKRDIQKRYYLKYPTVAYRIGKGTEFEILNINGAVSAMIGWCSREPNKDIRIIKDEKKMWTPDYIRAEKEKGNARIVIWVPKWIVFVGYTILKSIMGVCEKTYLLNKAVYPLKTENDL